MKENRLLVALLILVAFLLTANLLLQFVEPVTSAQADIVGGKNIFSTHSPDGQTIYLWGYTHTGTLADSQVQAFYYGSISLDGKLQRNQPTF